MNLERDPDDLEFESVDAFLDAQRRLLDDELPAFGGAALEDEPDELDP